MVKKLYGTPTLALALGGFLLWAANQFKNTEEPTAFVWRMPLDLNIYVLAGAELAAGKDLYDNPFIGKLPFTYPPFAGVLFEWLSYLEEDTVIAVWQFGTMAALAVVLLLVLRNRGIKLTFGAIVVAFLFALASVATEPLHGTLFFGQINVFLLLLVSLDFLPRRFRFPGIGIGLAAGLKLTPAFLGLVLLFQKRFWVALASIVTFGLTIAIGWWLIPDAKYFWTEGMFQSDRVGDHSNPGAQSLRSVLSRVFGIESPWPWLVGVAIIFAFTCLAVWVAVRKKDAATAMALTGISACLISPFSWYHHWVWIIPLAFVVLIAVNQAIGSALPGFFGAQVAGLGSLLAAAVVLLPFVSVHVAKPFAYRTLDDVESLQPWASLTFVGAGAIYILGYGVVGLIFALRSPAKGGRHRLAKARV